MVGLTSITAANCTWNLQQSMFLLGMRYQTAIEYNNYESVTSSSSGAELPLIVESFGLLNDLFPFPSMLDADAPVFNLHLANILPNVILPSVFGSSL
jgi:hypothetical protein